MMCFMYQAALLCAGCGNAERVHLILLRKAPKDIDNESTYDSDDFPKGPYESSEADLPQHCDQCGVFLENPLTDEGVTWLYETLIRHRNDRRAKDTILRWAYFYGVTLTDLLERTEPT